MIYLDYAATTPIDKEILEAYTTLLTKYYANAASHHPMGSQVERLHWKARQQIADLFKVSPEEIIFTSGATESNNLALKGIAFQYAYRGKHIITTCFEHPSILNACKQLQSDFGFEVTYLSVDNQGKVSIDDVKKALRKDTILVSIMSVNNEVGSCQNIGEISQVIRENSRAYFHSDMTQSIGKIDFDYSTVDLLSCSGHKIHGLKGSGFLLKRNPIQLSAQLCGGGQEFGYRSGTSNWPVNVLLAKTIRLALEQRETNYQYVQSLAHFVRQELSKISGILFNSPVNGSPYILNFSLVNHPASVVVQALEDAGICLSTSAACSSKSAHPSLSVLCMFKDEKRAAATIRVSFAKTTTKAEIVEYIDTLQKVLATLKSGEKHAI